MDAAFPHAPYPSYTTEQLRIIVARRTAEGQSVELMVSELDRRAKVAAGDRSIMTPGERLRHARKS